MILKLKIFYPFRVLQELNKMANALEALRREVAEAKAGQESAVALIKGLRDRLDAMIDTSADYADLQAQVEAMSTELSDSTDQLAAAVVEPGTGQNPTTEVPGESTGPVDNGNVNPGPVNE